MTNLTGTELVVYEGSTFDLQAMPLAGYDLHPEHPTIDFGCAFLHPLSRQRGLLFAGVCVEPEQDRWLYNVYTVEVKEGVDATQMGAAVSKALNP